MKILGNEKGSILAITVGFILVFTIFGFSSIHLSGLQNALAEKQIASAQAFWLAEAGVNKALEGLRNNYSLTAVASTALGNGGCSATIADPGDGTRTITAQGFIPFTAPSVTRVITVTIIKDITAGFYDKALYSAGNVNIGNNCVVNGDVISGGTVTGPVNGDVTQNDSVLHDNGLPLLNFEELRQKSIDQGWYNPITQQTTYPTSSFWYEAPSLSNPTGTPNIVFVNGNFTLVGGKQVVKGFIVVGGDTVYDAEIGGNASIVGCLYTRGDIWFHGGGGNVINVDGGIWAGGTITMNGNEQINFDSPGHGAEYMNAIRESGINADVQVISWQEAVEQDHG
jgi:hypothetical protein